LPLTRSVGWAWAGPRGRRPRPSGPGGSTPSRRITPAPSISRPSRRVINLRNATTPRAPPPGVATIEGGGPPPRSTAGLAGIRPGSGRESSRKCRRRGPVPRGDAGPRGAGGSARRREILTRDDGSRAGPRRPRDRLRLPQTTAQVQHRHLTLGEPASKLSITAAMPPPGGGAGSLARRRRRSGSTTSPARRSSPRSRSGPTRSSPCSSRPTARPWPRPASPVPSRSGTWRPSAIPQGRPMAPRKPGADEEAPGLDRGRRPRLWPGFILSGTPPAS